MALQGQQPLQARSGLSTHWPVFQRQKAAFSKNSTRQTPSTTKVLTRKWSRSTIGATTTKITTKITTQTTTQITTTGAAAAGAAGEESAVVTGDTGAVGSGAIADVVLRSSCDFSQLAASAHGPFRLTC
ncbi:hypothetical protein X733_08085 [Mesorhizobium sp. L2C067A000]|nr:hypothetical protein X733_08085 [Mesorhizobium sp. L2C067A000]